eukprot:COSAG05_NODE_538_length_8854_cov_306.308738_16_plen_72_part_00
MPDDSKLCMLCCGLVWVLCCGLHCWFLGVAQQSGNRAVEPPMPPPVPAEINHAVATAATAISRNKGGNAGE